MACSIGALKMITYTILRVPYCNIPQTPALITLRPLYYTTWASTVLHAFGALPATGLPLRPGSWTLDALDPKP